MKYLKRITRVLSENTDAFVVIEVIGAILAIGLGLKLMSPLSNIFAGNSFLYRSMDAIAPEWGWGAFYFALGCLRLYAFESGKYWMRRIMGYISVFWWTLCAVFVTIAAPASMLSFLFTAFAVIGFWESVRLRSWNKNHDKLTANRYYGDF